MADEEDTYDTRLKHLCQVQPGDTELMLVAREWIRHMREVAPTREAMLKTVREDISVEADFVELRELLSKLLSDEDS